MKVSIKWLKLNFVFDCYKLSFIFWTSIDYVLLVWFVNVNSIQKESSIRNVKRWAYFSQTEDVMAISLETFWNFPLSHDIEDISHNECSFLHCLASIFQTRNQSFTTSGIFSDLVDTLFGTGVGAMFAFLLFGFYPFFTFFQFRLIFLILTFVGDGPANRNWRGNLGGARCFCESILVCTGLKKTAS